MMLYRRLNTGEQYPLDITHMFYTECSGNSEEYLYSSLSKKHSRVAVPHEKYFKNLEHVHTSQLFKNMLFKMSYSKAGFDIRSFSITVEPNIQK